MALLADDALPESAAPMNFYHVAIGGPNGDDEPLEPDGSALVAAWHLRQTLRDEPPGTVGTIRVGPVIAARARTLPDGSIAYLRDNVLSDIPTAAKEAVFQALDAHSDDNDHEALLRSTIMAIWLAGHSAGTWGAPK